MKKYYTPEIEFEIISTSDICTSSGTLLTWYEEAGASPKVSWNDTDLWKLS
jgi:hypothetical protein